MIFHSTTESDLLGLKVGHASIDNLDATALRGALVEGAYDLCRLKVRMDQVRDGAISVLETTGIPYFYAGGILRYEVDYRTGVYVPSAAPRDDLQFMPVESGDQVALESMVRACFFDDPIGYYKTPYLAAILDRNAEVDCLIQYHLGDGAHERHAFLVERDGVAVGFLVMHVDGGIVHTPLLGILPKERGGHLFDPMRDFIHTFASEHGFAEQEGARIDNLLSQNVFGQDGLQHVANETIYHLTPFLQRGSDRAVKTSCSDSGTVADQLAGQGRRIVADRHCYVGKEPAAHAIVTVPVDTTHLLLVLVRDCSTQGQTVALRYREYRSSSIS